MPARIRSHRGPVRRDTAVKKRNPFVESLLAAWVFSRRQTPYTPTERELAYLRTWGPVLLAEARQRARANTDKSYTDAAEHIAAKLKELGIV